MGDDCYVAVRSWMGARTAYHRSVIARIRRRRESPAKTGGLDVAVFLVSEQRRSGHRCHEKAGVGQFQRGERVQRSAYGRRISLAGAPSPEFNEASLMETCP